MTKIIVEELNRLGHVTHRHRYHSLPIKVGRAYHNDLILSDAYVCPEHLVIDEADNGWQIEDKSNQNGVKFKRHSEHSHSNQLHSGDDIIIGRTRLRLFSPWHTVPEAHTLSVDNTLSHFISRPIIATTLIITAVFLLILNAQLASTQSLTMIKLVAANLPAFFVVLFWGGLWTFVGRTIIHRASFLPHFIAAVLLLIASLLVATLSSYIAYTLNDRTIATLFEFVFMGIAVVMLVYINLSNSTHITRSARLIISHSIAWSLLLFGLFMQYAAQPEFNPTPEYNAELKPPFAQLVPSKSPDAFLTNSEWIFQVDTDKALRTSPSENLTP